MKSLLKKTALAISLSFSAAAMMALPTLSVQAAVPTDKSLMALVKIIKLDETVKQMNSNGMTQRKVIEAMLPSFTTENMSDYQRQQVIKVLTNYTNNIFNDEYIESVNSANIKAYIDAAKKYFTQEEVNAQIAFYSTKVGASIIEKQPSMTQDYTEAVTTISTKLISTEIKNALPILIKEFEALKLKK